MDRRFHRYAAPGASARWVCVSLCTSLTLTVASAQQVTATRAGIVGRLVDQETHAPVHGARVAVIGAHHALSADSNGRFVDDSLASGTYVVQAHAIGYETGSWVVHVGDGETVTQEFPLKLLPYRLNPVIVERRPGYAEQWWQEFERRRASGGGYFITEDQIEAAHPRALSDLLRNVPGVQMICRGASHCAVRMLRSPRQCRVEYVVDGFPATNSTSPDMAIVGVVAVEVYRTLSETPIQFLRGDNMCGTIVIWTRSGPSVRAAP